MHFSTDKLLNARPSLAGPSRKLLSSRGNSAGTGKGQLLPECSAAQPDNFASTALSLSQDAQYCREVELGNWPDLIAAAPGDFYELLGLEASADQAAVRAAYRILQRLVHPDIIGGCGHELAILMNSAYATLSDPKARQLYDADLKHMRQHIGTFDGRPVSAWEGGPGESRGVFVDESACIGCRQCTHVCPDTFAMEEEFGRARVTTQWADDAEAVGEAVDLCPVDCIYYVPRDQLALLEFVMKGCKREDAATLSDRRSGSLGPGPNSEDPFEQARVFLHRRHQVKLGLEAESVQRTHDETLSAAIAKAWIALPYDVRLMGWPDWVPQDRATSY